MTKPKNTNNKIKGKRTKNQEICLCPALQIESKTKVQKATYKNLNKNTTEVLGTGHSKLPIQYVFTLPLF